MSVSNISRSTARQIRYQGAKRNAYGSPRSSEAVLWVLSTCSTSPPSACTSATTTNSSKRSSICATSATRSWWWSTTKILFLPPITSWTSDRVPASMEEKSWRKDGSTSSSQPKRISRARVRRSEEQTSELQSQFH